MSNVLVPLNSTKLDRVGRRTIGSPQPDVLCPECGSQMRLLRNKKYRYERQGDFSLFYGCSRYPSCKATHSAHPTGEPCGIPATPDVKAARIRAHSALRNRCERVGLSRREAYKWLSLAMGRPLDKTHIALFDIEDCEIVVSLCQGKEEL